MNDNELHDHLIGQQGSRWGLNTPVLILDPDALDRNIATMAEAVRNKGLTLRPHAKTHKSVEIARRQIAAGAVGLCCAKIGEAEVLADGGIEGLLITSPVTAPGAIERLAQLTKIAPSTIATVDDPDIATRINAELLAIGATLDVLIDIDPGIHRTGVFSPDAAVELAQAIDVLPNLRYRGVQFYCGSQQHIADYAERHAAIIERTDYLNQVIGALANAGFPPAIITGSGTGTHHIDMELGVFTELQAGSYVFMDQQYLDCDLNGMGAAAPSFATALAVDARVVSANHDGLVTIDAGYKALSTDGGVAVVQRGPGAGSRFVFMGDEHSALIEPGLSEKLRPGDAVSLTVPHCDPTVNLYDFYHVVKGDALVGLWPVSARGRAR